MRYFFYGSFAFFFVSCVSHAFASVHCCLVATCWAGVDLVTLVGDVYCIFVTFPCGILGQVWYLIVSFPDLCLLSSFVYHPSMSHWAWGISFLFKTSFPYTCSIITVNSEIFARVLFSRNFAYAKFRGNNTLSKWRKRLAFY